MELISFGCSTEVTDTPPIEFPLLSLMLNCIVPLVFGIGVGLGVRVVVGCVVGFGVAEGVRVSFDGFSSYPTKPATIITIIIAKN